MPFHFISVSLTLFYGYWMWRMWSTRAYVLGGGLTS